MNTQNVVAVADGGELTEDHFIGRLATYTLPDAPQSESKLMRAWAKHGLDVADLPGTRTPVHTFQSACRSIETRKRTNGHIVEIKVDEVFQDPNECVYQITRMVRDRAEKLIDHPKAMTVAFDKGTQQLTVRELEDFDALSGIEDSIRKHLADNEKRIPGQKLRNAIRDKIVELGGQNLRRKAGGLYFVPRTHRVRTGANQVEDQATAPVLDSIKGFLADVYGDRADFYIIPLVGDEGQRAMVRKHFTLNVNTELEEMTLRALNRVRNPGERGVRQEMIDGLWNDRRRIMHAIEDFERLVGAEKSDIDTNLRAMNDALVALEDFKNEKGA